MAERFRAAMTSRDWGGACACLVPRTQAKWLAALVFGAAYAAASPVQRTTLRRVLEKHGIEGTDMDLEVLRDLPGALEDMMVWVDEHLATCPDDDPLAGLIAQAPTRVTDLEIDGDRARGEGHGPNGTQELRFVRSVDRWLLALPS